MLVNSELANFFASSLFSELEKLNSLIIGDFTALWPVKVEFAKSLNLTSSTALILVNVI